MYSMWSLVRPVLLCDVISWEEKKSFNTNETFQVLIDLFAFLSSISRFPDTSEGGKIKLLESFRSEFTANL